jgi:glycine/D-amino acid oxidase-like deaminating enzyme
MARETASVLVIGGGVIGASITYALACRGVTDVILCEKQALASGASGWSSGLVQMHYTNEWDARLAHASFSVLTHWGEVMGEASVFTRTGCLYIVAPEYAENLRANVAMLCRIGVNTTSLTPAEVKELQPFMNVSDVGAAAFEPDAGFAQPNDTIQGFRRGAEARGASIRQGTPVCRILRTGDRVTGVELGDGSRIHAPVVVVTAGPWSPALFRELGVALPARPKGLDTAVVVRPVELSQPHMTVIDNVQGTYLRKDTGGLSIVGVPCQDWDVDPESATGDSPPSARLDAAQILTHRIPAMEGAEFQRAYRASDCYSPDRHAILDRVENMQGLYVATGFSGSGFKIAPAVGTCMAELILDGVSATVDIRPFGLRRFAEGRLLMACHPYAMRRDHLEPTDKLGEGRPHDCP